jgi:hypothetical protein
MKDINVKVQLESKGKATALEAIASKVSQLSDEVGNTFLNKNKAILKEGLLKSVHDQLSATGVFGSNSRLYQDVYVTAAKAKDSLNLTCRIKAKSPAKKYFKIWNYGGTITAKKSKYLSVPSKDSPYTSPRELDDKGDSLFSFVTPRVPASKIQLDKSGNVSADIRGTLYFYKKLIKEPDSKTPVKKDIVAKFTLVRSLTFKGMHWIENAQKEFIKNSVPKIIKDFDVAKAVTL